MDPKDRKSETGQAGSPEQELDAADLAMIQAAWSDLESVEPPELLDQAVLNAARRELAVRRGKSLRWIGAFATASVVVLALTIVVQQNREPQKTGRSNGAKLDAVAPLKAPAEAQSVLQKAQEESVSDAFNEQQPERSLPESRAVESGTDHSRTMKQSAAVKRELRDGTEMANKPAAAAAVPAFEAAPVAEGKELSVDADLRVDDAPADTESMEHFRDEAAKLKTEPRQSAVQTKEAAETEQIIGERVQVLGAATAAAPATEKDGAASMLPDPDEWIQRMLLLRRSELYEQLEEELAAFKLAYPDHPLPAELKD